MKELAGSFSRVMNESQTEEAAEKGVRTRRRPADLRQGQEFGRAPVKDRPTLKELKAVTCWLSSLRLHLQKQWKSQDKIQEGNRK